MLGFSRRAQAVGLLLLAFVAGCEPADRPVFRSDAGRELAAGRAYASDLSARAHAGERLGDGDVVALGYLERLRLGLGGPFRLIEYALVDPRLELAVRRRLGWALLERTLERAAYELDPRALDPAGATGAPPRAGIGRHHLALIEGAVAEARDPRAGELAVRLAYELAAAEASVKETAPALAAQAAALLRDRELARADAERLIAAAEQMDADALELLVSWREERRFSVEAPPLAPLPSAAEREAIELAPRLAGALRMLGPRLAGTVTVVPAAAPEPLLGPAAAARLSVLADSLGSPPQTPLVVALELHRAELLDRPWLSDRERAAREAFLAAAGREEAFAAEYARLLRAGPSGSTGPRTALWAAVALRAYAQERPWFPGFGGPSATALTERYGLADIEFDPAIPAAWRPYYRRMLGTALADLHRVLPALDVRGLRVRFGEPQRREETLALHDPRTRTVYLPPSTGVGTVAHEVAHDLDWQVALRRYNVRGDYGSDRATRRRHDRLASSVRGLTDATLAAPPAPSGGRVEHARRPAEVFARSLDWFVVAALARDGRTNGYLSSIQDALLTGYGTASAPDVSGGAGAALVAILDEVAPVHADTREAFLAAYGPGRTLGAYDLVRRVLDPTTRRAAGAASEAAALRPLTEAGKGLEALERAEAAALDAIDLDVCRLPGAAYDRDLHTARQRLVGLAAGARARGLALERARELFGLAGRDWAARRLYGAPWPAAPIDSGAAELLESIVQQARSVGALEDGAATGGAFRLSGSPERCGAARWIGEF